MILKNITAIKEINRIGGYPNNHGLSFDGLNEYLAPAQWKDAILRDNLRLIDLIVPWTFSSTFTYEDNAGAEEVLYSKYRGVAGSQGLRIRIGGAGSRYIYVQWNRGSSQSSFTVGTTALIPGNRYTITITYNANGSNTGSQVYINGVPDIMAPFGNNNMSFTTTTGIGITASPAIGCGQQNAGAGSYTVVGVGFFKGVMETMRFWDFEFNQAQVTDDYNHGNPSFPIFSDNMLADLNMGDDIITTAPLIQGDTQDITYGWRNGNMNIANIVTL